MKNRVYLASTRLKNYQSWKDITLDFSDGLNIFYARNNVGKSVFFKSLQLVVSPNQFTSKEREQHIRFFSEYAEVIHGFSDGYVCVSRIYPKKVIYFDRFDSNSKFRQHIEVPQDLLKRLSIIKTEGSDFIPNIMDLDHSKFLVSSDAKSNVELLKLHTYHEGLDRLKEESKERYKTIDRLQRRTKSSLVDVHSQLDSLKFVDEVKLQEDIKSIQDNIILTKVLLRLATNLDDIETLYGDNIDYDEEIIVADLCTTVTDICNVIKEIPSDDINIDDNEVALLSSIDDCITVRDLVSSIDIEDKPQIIDNDINMLDILVSLEEIKNSVELIDTNKQLDIDKEDVHLTDMCLALTDIKDSLLSIDEVQGVVIDNEDISIVEVFDKLSSIQYGIHQLLYAVFEERKSDIAISRLEKQIEDIKKELGGKDVECPIYGTITYVQGECLHDND